MAVQFTDEDSRAALARLPEDESITAAVEQVARMCCTALSAPKKILLVGNGESVAGAQHLADEVRARVRKAENPGGTHRDRAHYLRLDRVRAGSW